MKKIKINSENSGQRLDKFLVEKMSEFSRSKIQKMIENEIIKVNEKKVSKHYFLKKQDIVFVTQAFKSEKVRPKGLSHKIKIISETDDCLVINKPSGLLVHATENSTEKTLVDWLLKKYPEIKKVKDLKSKDKVLRCGIVHRLDRDVSGLIVIAKTQQMFNWLKKQFQSRQIKKEYTALVFGKVELDEGEISRSVTRSKKTGLMIARGTNLEQGKDAITEFEVLQRFKNYTLLKIKLITGRTHQIRVHLKSIGHSVVGDKLYQTRDVKLKKSKPELKNIFLCSTKLGFEDLDFQFKEFKIKLPTNLTKFLKELR